MIGPVEMGAVEKNSFIKEFDIEKNLLVAISIFLSKI